MKPVLKWAGGKAKLLGELLARVPSPIGTYFEPFAGGAALFFALADSEEPGATTEARPRPFARAVLCDRNEDLITFYSVVRDNPEALIRSLRRFKHDEELYYKVRAQDPKRLRSVGRAARFSFLNRTCFNGLWRVNKSGAFNVPFGRYKNPNLCDAEALRRASRALVHADVRTCDFQEVTREAKPGDFVYLDPPYMPLSKSAAFTAYATGGFTSVDQTRLRDELLRLRARGVYAMLSNADTEETRALYKDFCAYEVRAPRAINTRGDRRGDAKELIVVTWGEPGIHAFGSEGGPPPSKVATARAAKPSPAVPPPSKVAAPRAPKPSPPAKVPAVAEPPARPYKSDPKATAAPVPRRRMVPPR